MDRWIMVANELGLHKKWVEEAIIYQRMFKNEVNPDKELVN